MPPQINHLCSAHNKTQPNISSSLLHLKIEADYLLVEITKISKWAWTQRFSKFLTSMMINYNHSFVSQYTILYKSYMILVAFILTILCNFIWLKYGGLSGTHMTKNLQLFTNANKISQLNGYQFWMQNITLILPLKGRFSIVFFQLMFMTSIQIVYETIIQLHYRFSRKRQKYNLLKNKQSVKTNSSLNQAQRQKGAPTAINKSAQGQKLQEPNERSRKSQHLSSDHESTRIHYNSSNIITTPSIQYWQQSEILTSLLQLFNGLKCTHLKIYEYKLPITFKSTQFTYRPLLFETKFLYLFSLLYMDNILWQGIIIKQWKNKFIHLMIVISCIAEFLIWTVINIVLEGEPQVTFSNKQLLQIGRNGQISLGMY